MRLRPLPLALIVCCLLASAGLLSWRHSRAQAFNGRDAAADATTATLPEFMQLPDFELVNRDGRPIHKADLLGHVWILDFIYSDCTSFCPLMTRQMTVLRGKLGPNTDIRSISISVDPDKDKPAVLQKYAESNAAVTDKWLYLTGDSQQILRLLKTMYFVPQNATRIDRDMHSTRFVLIDKTATVRGFYLRGDDQQQQKLVGDAGVLDAMLLK
jgi:protein SCO1/2